MSDVPAPVRIDPELCAGHGRCYTLAPGLFDLDEMGRGVVRTQLSASDIPEDLDAVIAACPECAIEKLSSDQGDPR